MHQRARQLLGHGPLAVTILEHLNASGGKVPNFSIYNEHSESTASTGIAYFHAAIFNFSNLVYTTFRVMYECMIAMRICMLQTDSAMSTAATLTVDYRQFLKTEHVNDMLNVLRLCTIRVQKVCDQVHVLITEAKALQTAINAQLSQNLSVSEVVRLEQLWIEFNIDSPTNMQDRSDALSYKQELTALVRSIGANERQHSRRPIYLCWIVKGTIAFTVIAITLWPIIGTALFFLLWPMWPLICIIFSAVEVLLFFVLLLECIVYVGYVKEEVKVQRMLQTAHAEMEVKEANLRKQLLELESNITAHDLKYAELDETGVRVKFDRLQARRDAFDGSMTLQQIAEASNRDFDRLAICMEKCIMLIQMIDEDWDGILHVLQRLIDRLDALKSDANISARNQTTIALATLSQVFHYYEIIAEKIVLPNLARIGHHMNLSHEEYMDFTSSLPEQVQLKYSEILDTLNKSDGTDVESFLERFAQL